MFKVVRQKDVAKFSTICINFAMGLEPEFARTRGGSNGNCRAIRGSSVRWG